jgi:uncharacterized protein YjbJ (UPF0337 family)
MSVNWDQVEGRWHQLRGAAQEQWGKLTDDDLDVINGERAQLVGRLQARYGMSREQAERAVEEWLQPLRSMS